MLTENLIAQLAPYIVELIGKFKHRNDIIDPAEVAALLKAKIDSGELKIDQAIADIQTHPQKTSTSTQ